MTRSCLPWLCWGWSLLLSAACTGTKSINEVTVASASITGVQWASVDVVVGVSWANGVLRVVDTEGQVHTAAVNLSGPALGAVLDVSGADFANTTISLTLPPNRIIKGSDLFGTYAGTDVGLHVILGGEQHDLSNGAGVALSGGNFNLGFGVFFGYEWLDLSVSGGSPLTPTSATATSNGGTVASSSGTPASSSTGHVTSGSSSGGAVASSSTGTAAASSSGGASASGSSGSSGSGSSSSSGGPPIIEVTLSNAYFATTGVNLFNCSNPAQPPSPTTVSTGPIVCNPLSTDAGYSTAPVVVDQVVGCGNENAAVVQVTCAGTPSGTDVAGNVTLLIVGTIPGFCSASVPDGGFPLSPTDGGEEPDGGAGPAYDFGALASGHADTSPPLGLCADESNFCTPSDLCAFNQFSATVTVANVGP
jgi:hypothetical protein